MNTGNKRGNGNRVLYHMFKKYIILPLLGNKLHFLPYRNGIVKLPHDTKHVLSENVSRYDTISMTWFTSTVNNM